MSVDTQETQETQETKETQEIDGEKYYKASAIDALIERKLAERDKAHAEEISKTRALLPTLMVAAHAGGPGVDNHQRSWSLAEQEHAARGGEPLEHWELL